MSLLERMGFNLEAYEHVELRSTSDFESLVESIEDTIVVMPNGWFEIGKKQQENQLQVALDFIKYGDHDNLQTDAKTIIGAINELYTLIHAEES